MGGKLVAVQGTIQKDGSFTWGGDRQGDGALPGTYKVIVVPPSLSEYELEHGQDATQRAALAQGTVK